MFDYRVIPDLLAHELSSRLFSFVIRSQILFRSFALTERLDAGGGALAALKLCRKKCLNVIMVLFLLLGASSYLVLVDLLSGFKNQK